MADHYPYSNALSGTAVGPHSFGPPYSYGPQPAFTAPTATQPAAPQTYPQARTGATTKSGRKLTHKCHWEGCDLYFSCPHNVEQHIREVHTKEKPYECKKCGKAFTRPWGLYRHLEGKHGIVEAGPGRGRGGGLSRIGSDVPQKRKRWEGKKAVMGMGIGGDVVMGDGGVERDGGFGEQVVDVQQPMCLEQPMDMQPLPPAPVASEQPAFELNNFTLIPRGIACKCGTRFDMREALLAHLHDRHGEPNSPLCNCMVCLGTFGTAGSVDAAGVHAREKGAVMMREMMADDLFGAEDDGKGSNASEKVAAGFAPLSASPGGVDRQTAGGDYGVGAMLAAMGMTEEEFTVNMPKDPYVDIQQQQATPTARTQLTPPSHAEAEARPTGNTFRNVDQASAGAAVPDGDAMMAVGFDDVDGWLDFSADELFEDGVGKSAGGGDMVMSYDP